MTKKKSILLFLLTDLRLRLVLPIMAAGVVFAVMSHNITTDRSYKATARIWVQRTFNGGSGAQPGEVPDSPLMEVASSLNTFCEVVTSDAVLSLAYDDLQKRLPKDKMPDRSALSSVTVTPAKDSNIITVDFTADDPDVAVAAVDSVISAVMKENVLQTAGPLEETRARLEKQLGLARAENQKIKDKLTAFSHQHDSVSFADDISALALRRTDLEQELDECVREMAALKTKSTYLQTQIGFGAEDVFDVAKITNDPVVRSLKQSVADTQVKLIELRSKFQDAHPRVQRLKAMLEEATKEIAKRYSVLIGRVDSKFDSISADSDAQQSLLSDMIQARADMVVGEAKIGSLKDSLADVKTKLSVMPEQQQEYNELTRESDLSTNTLAAIESELQRVKLTESVSLSTSRMQVIDSSQSAQDMTPTYWRNAYVASAVAAALIIALQCLLDPRIFYMKAVNGSGLKIVGSIKSLGSSPLVLRSIADRLRMKTEPWVAANKIIWCTSPNSEDGKTTISLALAKSYSEAGKNVVLVDGNFRSPSLHCLLEQPASPGLLQLLQNQNSLSETVRRAAGTLLFIPAGGVVNDIQEIEQRNLNHVFDELAQMFDVVIVDSASGGEQDFGLRIPEIGVNLLVLLRLKNSLRKNWKLLTHQISTHRSGEVGVFVVGVAPSSVKSHDATTKNASVTDTALVASNSGTQASSTAEW